MPRKRRKQHTGGPWQVPADHPLAVDGGDGVMVADCCIYQRPDAECEANARLTATAPDLLEMVEDLLEECRDLWDSHGDDYDEGHDARMAYIFYSADELIAKARGREQREEQEEVQHVS